MIFFLTYEYVPRYISCKLYFSEMNSLPDFLYKVSTAVQMFCLGPGPTSTLTQTRGEHFSHQQSDM